jgi:hypothetical protein
MSNGGNLDRRHILALTWVPNPLTGGRALTDAPVHAGPTWHALPLLHRCFAGKTTRLDQVTSRYGPHRRAAGTHSSPYGRTPPPAECGSP